MDQLYEAAPLWVPGVAAMGCLIFASAFFSGSETALFYLSRDELRLLQTGKKRDRLAAELLRDPDRLLTAVLFWNLVINLLFFAISVVTARRLMAADYRTIAGVIGVGSLMTIILFGEVLPKSLAVVFRLRIAGLVSWPLGIAVRVLDAVLPPLQATTRALHRTFWPHIKREPYLQVDDLERAIEVSEAHAELVEQEQQVLSNILELSEMTAEEIMRPRGTYECRRAPVHLADLNGRVPECGYLMIQHDETDEIISAVPLATLSSVPAEYLEEASEPVVHVPWCGTPAATLQMLRDHLCSVATVVDEYGATIGIITYEDLLDTVLLPQPSRAKRVLRREPVLQVAPGRYHVDGLTTLRHLSSRLEIDHDTNVDRQLTVSGLLHDTLGRFPHVDDAIEWHGLEVKVIDAAPRGRVRVMISLPNEVVAGGQEERA